VKTASIAAQFRAVGTTALTRAFQSRGRKEGTFEMSTAVTESSFEQEVLQSEKPVIVDFWAEWCGPCHAVSPVLDKIAEERSDELRLVKVNIDEEPALAQKYGIVSIPTIVLFKNGEPAAAAIGAQPKGAIERSLGLAEAAA
jgi:thioredoxin 1